MSFCRKALLLWVGAIALAYDEVSKPIQRRK